jgi:peptidoglycan hydrolase-like protein with peptidoglycan-binding domain
LVAPRLVECAARAAALGALRSRPILSEVGRPGRWPRDSFGMKRLSRNLLTAGLTTTMMAVGLGVTPASPAAAARPMCTDMWRLHDGKHLYLNYIPAAAGSKKSTLFEPTCNLRRGNSGVVVRGLQVTLNVCYYATLKIDGKFGPRTEAALRSAQRRIGVQDDGVLGPQTTTHLRWIQGTVIALKDPCVGMVQSRSWRTSLRYWPVAPTS